MCGFVVRRSGVLTVGSLCTGIGGLDLGLERVGMRVIWQCEKDERRRSVLRAHWDVPIYSDIRDIGADAPRPDVLAGGIPCQPWSTAGLRRGVQDDRWLWPECARVIRILRPRYVIVENVPALLDGGIEHVLGGLAALGFDAEWTVLSACAMGAPHTRDRLFIVAYPNGSDGLPRVGLGTVRPGAIPAFSDRAGAWRDRVDRSLAASRADGREADGSARWMVEAGGNAVVPDVAEYIGGFVTAHNRGAA